MLATRASSWIARFVVPPGFADRWATTRLIPQVSGTLAVALAITVVGGAALSPASSIATGALVEAITEARSGRLMRAVVAVGVLFAARQVSAPVLDALASAIARGFDGHLRRGVMDTVLAPSGIAHLEDPGTQQQIELARSISVWEGTPGWAVYGLATIWTARLGGIGSLLLVAWYSWPMALLLAAVALVVVRTKQALYLRMSTEVTGNAEELRRARWFRDLALTPEACKETRVFGLGSWAVRRFDVTWLAAMQDVWRQRRRAAPLVFLAMTGRGAAAVLAVGMTARSALRGDVSLGALVAFAQAVEGSAVLSYTLGQPEIFVEQGVTSVRPALALERTLRAQPRMPGELPADPLPQKHIRFEHVAFAYPGRREGVFTGLDLEIPAGRSLAIVGANGAGKTTIVKLLARLYDPAGGRILVDGVDLRDVDPEAWHTRVAAIFQDFVRYPFTLAENVAVSSLDRASEMPAVASALGRAGAAELGERVGWDTILDKRFDGGAELSGGEWQRIALARALFAVDAGARVLVLDEPTAHLDVRAEAQLYERFLDITHGLTTIVISHRFSTVRRADRIAVLEHGLVVEQGSHDELVAADGRYARLFALQAGRFRE